jgi:hypothetical protein
MILLTIATAISVALTLTAVILGGGGNRALRNLLGRRTE